MRALHSLPALVLCAFAARSATALDLKVDVPRRADSVAENNAAINEAANAAGSNAAGNSLDLPPMPSLLVPRAALPEKPAPRSEAREAAQAAAATLTSEAAFPSPACLQDNIRFWEQIYSDLDVNEAFLHDRSDLGRIYARVSLPATPAVRKLAVTQTAEIYRTKLLGLAGKLDAPQRWDRHERELAGKFEAAALTRASLEAAAANLRIQSGLRSRFEAGVSRSLNYLPAIHKVVAGSGLPLDIMMLPHVESSFVAHAKSKVGASGLWQLMPSTMRLLLGAQAVDKRHDIETSTIAATKLLRQNFEATRSWPLALTAYNHGLNGVLRGIRATGSADLCEIIAKYQSPSFRFASSNFYAQFLAARNVAGERYRTLAEAKPKGSPLRQVLLSAKGAL